MAWLKVAAIIGIAIVVSVGVLSFVPLPGYFNANVTVTSYVIPAIIATVYGISGVSASNAGAATIIDWPAFGFGIAWFSLNAQFTMTVCLNPGNHCSSKSASQWFPTSPLNIQTSVTNSFVIGYVPSGSYSVSVSLTSNGNQVASGSGSVSVG